MSKERLERLVELLALTLTEAGDLPREIQILPRGWVRSAKGEFLVDDTAIQELLANAAQRQNDLVVDYEHQTLLNVEAPAAAWIKRLFAKPDGVWAEVEWTPRAAEYLRNREYRYLSPVVGVRKSDKRAVFLHSAALTNTPAIDGMVPIMNKHDGKEDDDAMDELRKKLIELLGLKADADDEAITQAVEALKGQTAAEVVAHKDVLSLLELGEDATVDQVKARILMLKNPSAYVPVEEFNALKRRLDERDAEDLVQLALKEGKIAPASADWLRQYALKDPSGARAFVESAPQIVPVGTSLVGGKQPPAPDAIDDLQASINKQLGISDEVFKKWNGSEA